MAMKGARYAYMEAIQFAMRQKQVMLYTYELSAPTASSPNMPPIDLEKEFGRSRVWNAGIDEEGIAMAAMGAGLIGVSAVSDVPAQGVTMPFELIERHISKYRTMSGGQYGSQSVLMIGISGQGTGAGQHADYQADSFYMHTPGIKTVIPSTPYDFKGLLVSAIKDPDLVIYLSTSGPRALVGEVPDNQYEVPIGQAAIRQEGTQLTIVSSGDGFTQAVNPSLEKLKAAGISAEVIDLRTLNPLDRATLAKSAAKTKRVLTVDQSPVTLCPGAEVIASIALEVPGVRFGRVAFPDSPPPAAPELMDAIRPNAGMVEAAAKRLVG